MSVRAGAVVRASDPTESLFWFLADDSGFAWVGNGSTRGQAIARTAEHFGNRFIDYEAHRVYGRWQHYDFESAGWRYEDGTLAACERGDEDAQPFWEVTLR